MALLSAKRIPGATLIEVIVALVIIMIIFGIAMMIYINVLNSSTSAGVANANLLLKEISEETIVTKRYFDEQINNNELIIVKSVKKYNNLEGLIHLHLE